MGDQRHDRGFSGEQDMGFFLGERGYFIVNGPSGAAGHGITEKGFDGVAYNPERDHLIIYDNKAWSRRGSVGSASSIDQNLLKNLSEMERHVARMSDMPRQGRILDLLRHARMAVGAGALWPIQVQIAVSNAGGRKSGISSRLASSGISFIDYY